MADNLKIDMSKYTHIDDNGNIIQPQSGRALNAIVNSAPMNALLGFGDAAGDFVRGGLHLAGKPFGTSFDPATLIQQNRNAQGNLQFQPMQSSQGGAYNIGHIGGSVAPIIGLSELAPLLGAGRLAEALPQSLKLAPNIAGWSGVGAVGDPNNPISGAREGALMGGIGESIAPAVRGVGKLADSLSEKFYPEKFSKELVDQLRKDYELTEDESAKKYNTVLDKYKKDVPENYLYDPKETTYKIDPYFLSDQDLKTEYKNFLKSPTINNAHSLKSSMGSLAHDLDNYNSSPTERRMGRNLKDIKDQFGNIINNVLKSKNSNDASLYREASDYFRDNLVPYRENKKLYDIVSNNTREIDPSDLSKALADVSNQSKVPENHYIAQANEELEKRLFGGKILGKALQKTPGGQLVAPGMASILSSPTIRGFASNTQPYADKLKTLMLANLLQGNQ